MALSNKSNRIEINTYLNELDREDLEELEKTYFNRGLDYVIALNHLQWNIFLVDIIKQLRCADELPLLMSDITMGYYKFVGNMQGGVTSSISAKDIHSSLQLIAGSGDPIALASKLTQLYSMDLLDHKTAILKIQEEQFQELLCIVELFKKAQISFPKVYIDQFLMHNSVKKLAHLIINFVSSDCTYLCDRQIMIDLSPFFLIKSISTCNLIFILLRNNYLSTYDNFIRMIECEDEFLDISWEEISLHTPLNQSNIDDIVRLAQPSVSARKKTHASSCISEYLKKQHPCSRDAIFRFRSILKSKTWFNTTDAARNYSKIATELKHMYPVRKVIKLSTIYNTIRGAIIKYSHKYTYKSVDFIQARKALEAIYRCTNSNSPIVSGLSLNKLLYFCYESIHAQNKGLLERNWMQLIQTLAEITLIQTAQKPECNPKHVFEDLIKVILFLNPNLITIVRDFSTKLANEYLEYLIESLAAACSIEHAEYSWEQGIVEIGHHLYNEFQTKQECYLPNTGLFPSGRFSPQYINFIERAIETKKPQQDNSDVKKTNKYALDSSAFIDLCTKESPRGSFFKSHNHVHPNDNKVYPFSNDSFPSDPKRYL